MASKSTPPFTNLPPFRMATFLRAAEQRYENAQTSHKFELWRRVRAFSFDAMRELHNFHDAMRRQVPTLRCAECVGHAVHASETRTVQRARQELAGLDLSMVWSALWAICQEVAAYVGGGAVLGGVVGGVGGAFFGGVGAVPGAVGGASVGAEIGGWLLGLIGIKCLVEYISKAIPEMAGEYGRGFAHAWHAGELEPNRSMDIATEMHNATEAFAHGHLLLVTAILSAIVLYLSRGVLGKAQLYGELARSRLGPRFARWVEANEALLLKHPRLQPTRVQAMQEATSGVREKGTAKAPERKTGTNNNQEPKEDFSDAQADNVFDKARQIRDRIGSDIKNHPLRQAYEEEVRALGSKSDKMLEAGMPDDDVAHAMWKERRDLGVKYKELTPEPLRDYIYEVNTKRYGDPLGPKFEDLIDKHMEKGLSYDEACQKITASSATPNSDVNALLSKFEGWLQQKNSAYLDAALNKVGRQ